MSSGQIRKRWFILMIQFYAKAPGQLLKQGSDVAILLWEGNEVAEWRMDLRGTDVGSGRPLRGSLQLTGRGGGSSVEGRGRQLRRTEPIRAVFRRV